jgi:hypothetical protein
MTAGKTIQLGNKLVEKLDTTFPRFGAMQPKYLIICAEIS